MKKKTEDLQTLKEKLAKKKQELKDLEYLYDNPPETFQSNYFSGIGIFPELLGIERFSHRGTYGFNVSSGIDKLKKEIASLEEQIAMQEQPNKD